MKIYECPTCEDRDCQLNVCGLCHDIDTILNNIPSDMYTCSNAIINFKRIDTIYENLFPLRGQG